MPKCAWCEGSLSGKQRRFCSSNCRSISKVTAWRKRTKRRAIEFLGGKCQRCGYSKCSAAMIFHHPGEKSFGISQSGAIRSWNTIEKELEKCILLCLNCHAEEHHPESR